MILIPLDANVSRLVQEEDWAKEGNRSWGAWEAQ